MHNSMHVHYRHGHRHHRPFWPGLLFLLLLFLIFKGFIVLLLVPVVVFTVFCLVTGITRMVIYPASDPHDDEHKRKNDDRRYVQTEDGEWVEIV